jgi:hypothetical protein
VFFAVLTLLAAISCVSLLRLLCATRGRVATAARPCASASDAALALAGASGGAATPTPARRYGSYQVSACAGVGVGVGAGGLMATAEPWG